MSVIQGDVGGGGTDATITFSDITTNDVSSTKHGFMPKLPNTATKFWRDDGTYQTISGGGDALVANPLSQFASTTSAQLRGVISDETGSGVAVFATSPTLVTPVLGVATATSLNKVAVTAPATSSTLTIQDGFTLTVTGNASVSGTHTGTSSGTNTGDVANTALTTSSLAQFASTTSAEMRTLLSDETGTGVAVFATSPTLVTPTLGAATVTTVNKVTVTAPATGSTLTIADGKTLTVSNDATVSGTNTGDQTISDATISTSDITTNNFTTAKHGFVPKGTNIGNFLKDDGTWAAPAGGGDALTTNTLAQFASTTSAQLAGVISNETGSGSLVFATSPTLVTPALGVASATTINKVTVTAPATGSTLTIQDGFTLTVSANATVSGTNTGDVANTAVTTGKLSQFAATSSSELAGVISDETGSGALVFATSPTLVTPTLGVASATSLALGNGNITAAKQVCFNGVVAGGNKTGATQNLADWTAGSACTITLTGNCTGTSTMTSPTGVSRLTLIILQDGTGSRTISTWPATVKWAGGTVPTLSTAASAIDIITFLWNGTNYFGMAGIGFA